MSNKKMRKEFEAWFAASHPIGNLERTAEEVLRKMIAFQGWEASRAALVVVLPDYLDTDKLGFQAYEAGSVTKAIEAAGVKTK